MFCRAGLIECFLRLAKHSYCDIVTERQIKEAEARGKTMVRTSMLQGFATFIKEKLKPYLFDEQIGRLNFRENQLFNDENDLVFSMN